jgi:hypothetical protein
VKYKTWSPTQLQPGDDISLPDTLQLFQYPSSVFRTPQVAGYYSTVLHTYESRLKILRTLRDCAVHIFESLYHSQQTRVSSVVYLSCSVMAVNGMFHRLQHINAAQSHVEFHYTNHQDTNNYPETITDPPWPKDAIIALATIFIMILLSSLRIMCMYPSKVLLWPCFFHRRQSINAEGKCTHPLAFTHVL